MAYGAKWEFKFNSNNGVETLIRVSKDGYSGSKTSRALGKAPVIKMAKNGNIKTTSLSFDCECKVDGEFSEFYTTNPREFKVEVFRWNTIVFTGFIVTEIFSEPLIAPPYDVSINAVDGLSELKMVEFTPTGSQKLITNLKNILDQTGMSNALNIVSDLRFGSDTSLNFVKYATINLDYMEGKNCYEVLEYLMDTLHATIFQYNATWCIVRENDVTVDNYGSVACKFVNRSGTVSSTSLNYVTAAVQKYNAIAYWSYRANMWPIGKLTRRVEAAKKSVTIEAPWNVNENSMYPSVEDNGWTMLGTGISFDSTHKCYVFGYPGSFLHAEAYLRNFNYDIEIKLRGSISTVGTGPYTSQVVVNVSFAVSGGSTYYYSEANGWATGAASAYTAKMKSTNTDKDPATADEYSFIIPASGLGAGSLTITLTGQYAEVYSVTTEVKMNKGYQDTIIINNGARGEAGKVTIGGGRVTSDTVMNTSCLQGIWFNDTAVASSFQNGQGNTGDFLTITALDYARSVALPRLRVLGVLEVPYSTTNPPLILRVLNQDYWIETFEWDLLNEEITVDSLSLPTATLSVTSETVKPIE